MIIERMTLVFHDSYFTERNFAVSEVNHQMLSLLSSNLSSVNIPVNQRNFAPIENTAV